MKPRPNWMSMSMRMVLGPVVCWVVAALELVGAEEADAVDLADHRGVHAGQRAGVADAVGRGDLGGAHGPGVEDSSRQVLVGEKAPPGATEGLPSIGVGPDERVHHRGLRRGLVGRAARGS